MFDLENLPMVVLPGAEGKRLDDLANKEAQSRAIAQGRAARRRGLSNTPPLELSRLKYGDLALDWANGWRWEDEGWYQAGGR